MCPGEGGEGGYSGETAGRVRPGVSTVAGQGGGRGRVCGDVSGTGVPGTAGDQEGQGDKTYQGVCMGVCVCVCETSQ